MGAAPPVATAEMLERYTDAYLLLWRQLENVTGENKWLEGHIENAADLQERTRQTIKQLSPEPSVLLSDYQKTQELVSDGARANAAESAAFREYLRDNGLRYAQLAANLLINDTFELCFLEVWNVLFVPARSRPVCAHARAGDLR